MELRVRKLEKNVIKHLPERVKVDETLTVSVKNQTAIITEYENEIAVGYKAHMLRRHFGKGKDNSFTVVETGEAVGEYKMIPKESTLDDIVKTINELVDLISTNVFGKA